jgi:hypothetical protein
MIKWEDLEPGMLWVWNINIEDFTKRTTGEEICILKLIKKIPDELDEAGYYWDTLMVYPNSGKDDRYELDKDEFQYYIENANDNIFIEEELENIISLIKLKSIK